MWYDKRRGEKKGKEKTRREEKRRKRSIKFLNAKTKSLGHRNFLPEAFPFVNLVVLKFKPLTWKDNTPLSANKFRTN